MFSIREVEQNYKQICRRQYLSTAVVTFCYSMKLLWKAIGQSSITRKQISDSFRDTVIELCTTYRVRVYDMTGRLMISLHRNTHGQYLSFRTFSI
jgi:replication initiation and membrane attachment protein DnaB